MNSLIPDYAWLEDAKFTTWLRKKLAAEAFISHIGSPVVIALMYRAWVAGREKEREILEKKISGFVG